MSNDMERIVVHEPTDTRAGLGVTYRPNPGPHETKFTVDQLWAPYEGEEHGRAEPVYVGDELRAISLIEALSEVVQIDMELRFAEDE